MADENTSPKVGTDGPDEPLRQYPEKDGVEQGSVHEVDGSTVSDTYHKPGDAKEDAEQQQTVEEVYEAVQAENDERQKAIDLRSSAPVDNSNPALQYAGRDNIVHPGPVGSALAAEAKAQELINEQPVRVDVDLEVLRSEAESKDEPAQELYEEKREETVEDLVEDDQDTSDAATV